MTERRPPTSDFRPIRASETQAIIGDVGLALWQREFEAVTIPQLEAQVFQTDPRLLGPGWLDLIPSSHHRFLPDEAPTDLQRWLSMECAQTLRNRVMWRYESSIYSEPDRRIPLFSPEEVIEYYQHFSQDEPADYTLGHVFAAVKRYTLAAYHRQVSSAPLAREDYQNWLRVYRLMEQAISLDTGPGPVPPGQPPSTK
jgi:hypothetical protein